MIYKEEGRIRMKTIGLIGGMSWESSIEYYKLINELVKEKLGGVHSCKSIMNSVDFSEIEKLQHNGEWEKLTEIMVDIAKKLEKTGADCIVICTNTMHKMAEDIEREVKIPLIHIADSVGENIVKLNLKKVALIGTKFTMEQDFYKERIRNKFGIEVIIPNENDKNIVHRVIYEELVKGQFRDESRKEYIRIIRELTKEGAEGVILGCTEIPLLISQTDVEIPIFDTTKLHSESAVEFALKD